MKASRSNSITSCSFFSKAPWSGGIAFVGRTGEDYAVPYGNSVVVQTDDPRELGAHLTTLRGDGALAARIRAEGRETARRFAWPALLDGYEAAWDAGGPPGT